MQVRDKGEVIDEGETESNNPNVSIKTVAVSSLKETLENGKSIDLKNAENTFTEKVSTQQRVSEHGIKKKLPVRTDLDRVKTSSQICNNSMAKAPPSSSENLQNLRETASRTISRSRQRKEAAEERLKGLFSSVTLSSDGSSTITYDNVKNIGTNECGPNQSLPETSRKLFDVTSRENLTNDENNIIRPSPVKANKIDENALADMENFDPRGKKVVVGTEVMEESKCGTKEHFSQQMNIQVMENFFVFKI